MRVQSQDLPETGSERFRPFEIIGVRKLNKCIMATIGKAVLKINPKEKMPSYFIGQPFKEVSLIRTKKWLVLNEAAHFFGVIMCGVIGYFFFEKGFYDGVIILLFIVVLNFYLILMQRMNRKRIRKTIQMLNQRKKPTNASL